MRDGGICRRCGLRKKPAIFCDCMSQEEVEEACTMYHRNQRKAITEPKSGIRGFLCPECRARLEKEVDEYVERLRKHSAKTEESVVSGR